MLEWPGLKPYWPSVLWTPTCSHSTYYASLSCMHESITMVCKKTLLHVQQPRLVEFPVQLGLGLGVSLHRPTLWSLQCGNGYWTDVGRGRHLHSVRGVPPSVEKLSCKHTLEKLLCKHTLGLLGGRWFFKEVLNDTNILLAMATAEKCEVCQHEDVKVYEKFRAVILMIIQRYCSLDYGCCWKW